MVWSSCQTEGDPNASVCAIIAGHIEAQCGATVPNTNTPASMLQADVNSRL
jgi:hypothetical protein